MCFLLTTKAVESATLAFQSIDHVHGCDSLPLGRRRNAQGRWCYSHFQAKRRSFLCSPARLERDFDFASLATAGHVDTVSVTLILVNDGRRMLARARDLGLYTPLQDQGAARQPLTDQSQAELLSQPVA